MAVTLLDTSKYYDSGSATSDSSEASLRVRCVVTGPNSKLQDGDSVTVKFTIYNLYSTSDERSWTKFEPTLFGNSQTAVSQTVAPGSSYTYTKTVTWDRSDESVTVKVKCHQGSNYTATASFTVPVGGTAPTVTLSVPTLKAGQSATLSWSTSDADGDTVKVYTLYRYYKASDASSFTETELSVSSSAKSYTDTIPASYAGGQVYYELTVKDTYGDKATATSAIQTIASNTAPGTPGIPSFSEPKGGEALTVSWTAASDSDGNLSGYILQVQLDGGSWTQIYKGSARTYSYTVPKGMETIAFRVKAYDSYSAESAYATSSTVAVSNDIIGIQGANAIISGIQKDLTGVGYVCIAGVWKSLVNSYTCIDGIWKSMMGGSNIVNLPDGYTRAEYIRSTGTQWIDTGFIPNANTRIVMDVENLTATASTGYFGTRSAASGTNPYSCTFFTNINGEANMRLDYYGSSKTVSCNSLQRLQLDWNKNITTIGDITTVTSTASSNSSTYNLCLLAINTAGSPQFGANAKLYSCQIYDNGTLIRDYIPCANPNGEAGLWDRANGVFYGNSGSGEFLINGELPSGYKQVEYIQSSGTQYIDTAFTANNNTKVVMDCEITYPSGWAMVMGSYNSGAYFSWWTKDSNIYAYYGSANQNTTGSTGRTTITADKNIWSAGDSSLTFTASSFTATTPIYLFSISNGGDYALGSMKLYSCQIYDNGTLVRSFVPCTNTSGTAGLYDVVNGIFYTNAGTGEFTAGQ